MVEDTTIKSMYSSDVLERVKDIVYDRMRKYAYLFED